MKNCACKFLVFIVFITSSILYADLGNEPLLYTLKSKQKELYLAIDYPLGWSQRENSVWTCLFENQGDPGKMMGFHGCVKAGFNMENISDVMNLFDHLYQGLQNIYPTRSNFQFSPSKDNIALCSFRAKTETGEEAEVQFVTCYFPHSGAIFTWMDSAKDLISLLQKNAITFLYPKVFFYDD